MKATNPELAQDILNYAHGIDEHAYRKTREELPFGLFFLITKSSSGYRGRNLTTRVLQRVYKQVCSKPIPEFRKAVANTMWEGEFSGQQIEAFLGHNHVMHMFGSSSSWTILDNTIPVREWQESYLKRHGWKPFHLVEAKLTRFRPTDIPCFEAGTNSYEGRKRSKLMARSRAIQAIRTNLPPHWFYKNEETISDTDIRDLKDRVALELSSDPEALSQIGEALQNEIESLRKKTGNLFDSMLALPRSQPSPITITTSRHFRIAQSIREWWLSRIGSSPYGKSSDSLIERLAEIGISLVLFDAVLDKRSTERVLGTIVTGQIFKAHGCVFTRYSAATKTATFTKEFIFSPITSALLVGYWNSATPVTNTSEPVAMALRRMRALLKSTGHPDFGATSSINRLIEVFRSWWMIRLPGPLLVIATAEQPGPAADLISTCAMYGKLPPGISLPEPKPQQEASYRDVDAGIKQALGYINAVLHKAAGEDTGKSTHTRMQRRRLAEFLDKRNTDEMIALDQLAAEQQSIDLMLGFFRFLLEEGGIREDKLVFNSIRAYYSRIQSFIRLTWNRDIEAFTSEDFDALYREMIDKASKGTNIKVPLERLHTYLMGFHGAPPSSVAASGSRLALPVRDSLIPVEQFEKAWQRIPALYHQNHLGNFARTFMYLAYDHALRPREIIGFKEQYVIGLDPVIARVSRNSVRDLKTSAAYRMMPAILSTQEQDRTFRHAVETTRLAPNQSGHLFNDPEAPSKLIPPTRITSVLTREFRAVTGNPMVVPYSQRQTAATRLAHRALRSPRSIPLSPYFESSIIGPFSDELFHECIDGGFNAWPFWFDHSAMLMGHAGSETLLGTYWHSSSLKLAEYTWEICPVDRMTDQQLANMLGRERSAITHQKRRLAQSAQNENKSAHANERLIVHYILNSPIPDLGIPDIQEPKKRGRPKKDESRTSEPVDVETDLASWISYHRTICHRFEKRLSDAETKEVAIRLGINAKTWNRCFSIYGDIVNTTGFNDFEPENPSGNSRPKTGGGVLHGATVRERALASIFRTAIQSEQFRNSLSRIVELWIERVNPNDPWFVMKDMEELNIHLEFLKRLGIHKDQLECCCTNIGAETLKQFKSKLKTNDIQQRPERLSRGYSGIHKSELGLRVKQKKDSIIGDYRDTHRILLLVSVLNHLDATF